ncbi:MAG: XRE family transcriptional regulator [Thermodesulfobacterium sp.]|nr:XRE family transcriptional regulator [Thermodesulfobacterium sp.]
MNKYLDKNIGEKIKKLREKLGMTQAEFAQKIFLSRSRLSELEAGKGNPSNPTIEAICSVFKVNKDWLLHGEGPIFVEEPPVKPKPKHPTARLIDLEDIPVVAKVGAGFPQQRFEDVEVLYYIQLPAGKYPKKAFAVEVTGDSMNPLLEEGDIVICKPFGGYVTDIPNKKVVVVATDEGELMIKRLKKYGDPPSKVIFYSDNPNYPPVEPSEGYRLVGVALELIKKIRL